MVHSPPRCFLPEGGALESTYELPWPSRSIIAAVFGQHAHTREV
jgi:hypothetical protein